MSLGFIGTYTALGVVESMPWLVGVIVPYILVSLYYRVKASLHTIEQVAVGLVLGGEFCTATTIWRSKCQYLSCIFIFTPFSNLLQILTIQTTHSHQCSDLARSFTRNEPTFPICEHHGLGIEQSTPRIRSISSNFSSDTSGSRCCRRRLFRKENKWMVEREEIWKEEIRLAT